MAKKSQFRRTDGPQTRIDAVQFVAENDDSPDLSWIGEYTSSPGPDDRTIDREERGDRERGQHRYFVAAMSGEESGNPASVEEDYKRMESYGDGWNMMFLYATAAVYVKGVRQTIQSGGVGGVESDCGADHLAEMRAEQLSELSGILESLGFSKRVVKAAVRQCVDRVE
jgi:hypothetical protein